MGWSVVLGLGLAFLSVGIAIEHRNLVKAKLLKDGDIPQFFIIGAAKSGTTSLDELLSRHPEICHASVKEKHYFDKADHYEQGLSFYASYFEQHPGCKYHIDSTPAYIRTLLAPQRMNETFTPHQLAKKKFILLLREPSSRDCSWYKHFVRGCLKHIGPYMKANRPVKGRWNVSEMCADRHNYCLSLRCGENVANITSAKQIVRRLAQFDSLVDFTLTSEDRTFTSFYDFQLRNWLKYVRRDQILIISMDDLIFKTGRAMLSIQKFLGLKWGWPDDVVLPESNVNDVKGVICDCATVDKLRSMYASHNTLENTYRIINSADKNPAQIPFTPFNLTKKSCT